jgi:hypothetical protein
VFEWPASGQIAIDAFPAQVKSVSFLTGEVLPFSQIAGRLEIMVPFQAPDPAVTVLRIQ